MQKAVRLLFSLALLTRGAVAAENCASVAVTAIPSCAQGCFLDGASFVGCDSLDFGCQCGKEAALYAAIEPCVATGCPSASFQAVINGASSVCGCAVAGSGGGKTVSGSFVSAISSPSGIGSSPATATPSGGAGGASASPTQGGGGGDSWNPLPTRSPFATSSPVNAAGRQSSFNLGMLASAVGATIALIVMS
ncbi:CFEM domain-containing protein [Colletotrichum plurivorum]|uniref:CFEM domain-containing protein n=1 Tax=Colletotrichum plurivorum TaxID=2175906 RepID=A0A8H6K6Z9_9PEZI|nr:CFEM domain-containing protein [Colletotrichum plurivorum]